MAQVIKNMNDLKKALEPKIKETLELVAEDVKQEIRESLEEYYREYDPSSYIPRTKQLLNCCEIGEVKVTGNGVSIEVYLDIDSLDYTTKGADPYKTVRAADMGLHGGYDPSDVSLGQVPWSIVSGGNIGERYGDGTQIWSEPMKELIDNGKLIESFKKHAKARGLNIK